MEPKHYRRIEERALAEAAAAQPLRRNWKKPLAIVVGSLATLVLAWMFISRAFPDDNDEEVVDLAEVSEQEIEGVASEMLRDDVIGEFVSSVLNAKSVEELLELVDHPEESEPRMREFHQQGGMYELPMGGSISMVGRLDHRDETLSVAHLGRLSGFGSAVVVPIRQTDGGEPTLRWEELVGWMDPDWSEILESKPEEATRVKAFALEDDYYNYGYRDESKWRCFRLKDRSLEHSLYAYLDRSSPEAEKLESFGFSRPMTVEIKFAPGQKRDQVEIVKFHHFGWMED